MTIAPDPQDRIFLTDRVFIVTGAGMGMGQATALLLAKRGARVIVSDVQDDAGQETAATINALGGEARFIHADIAVEEDVKALVEGTLAAFGRIDGAVNNAAIAPDVKPIVDADLDRVDRVLAVNLRGLLLCMKYEIRALIAQGGGGTIVNIGSVSSVRPQPNNPAYVAAKHGVIGLTKTGAVEYAGHGIRVNAVLPGAIDTPMIRAALAEHDLREEDFAPALSLFNRFGRPEEVAEASAWLCSDAASFVTGHALAVEAGYLSR